MTKLPECQFCHSSRDLHTLPLQVDPEDPETKYELHVCGSCWEAVIGIVLRMLKIRSVWDEISHELNVSPPCVTETSGNIDIKIYPHDPEVRDPND